MAARTFTDSAGIAWEVFEVRRATQSPRGVSPGLESGWLSFVSAESKRRLAPFPASWESSSDRDLERLCNSARVAAPARYPGIERRARPRDESLRDSSPVERRAEPDVMPVDPETAEVRETVQTFARSSRETKLPAVEALVRLKALLTSRFSGEGVSPRVAAAALDLRRVRRWFVEAYYFERR